jgi:hypothetical protein
MLKYLLAFAVILAALLVVGNIAVAQEKIDCPGQKVLCDTDFDGIVDDCCSCGGQEDPCDSDGDGVIDGCCGAQKITDPCHGKFDPAIIAVGKEGLELFACCMVPRSDMAKLDPCHGKTMWMDTFVLESPGVYVSDGYKCCKVEQAKPTP